MKRYNITVNGKAYDVAVEEIDGAAPAAAPAPNAATSAAAAAPAAAAKPAAAVEGTKIAAPMPGMILDVKVAVGDSVKKGQALFVLEAMKMENDVNSTCDGTVLSLNASKGSSVETGTVLAVIG